jgi:hypothetical protein
MSTLEQNEVTPPMTTADIAKFKGVDHIFRPRTTGAEVKVDIKVLLAFPSRIKSGHEATDVQRCHLFLPINSLPIKPQCFIAWASGICILRKAEVLRLLLAVLDNSFYSTLTVSMFGRTVQIYDDLGKHQRCGRVDRKINNHHEVAADLFPTRSNHLHYY